MQNSYKYNGLTVYKRLLGLVKPFSFALFLGMVGTIISSGVDAGFTYLLKPILDKGFVQKDMHFIHVLPFMIMGLFVVRGLMSFMSSYFITSVGRSVVMVFRK